MRTDLLALPLNARARALNIALSTYRIPRRSTPMIFLKLFLAYAVAMFCATVLVLFLDLVLNGGLLHG